MGPDQAPDFLRPGLSLREHLKEKVSLIDRETEPTGETGGYQALLNEASVALVPYLGQVVEGTRDYRSELARQLRRRKMADADNLDDQTFLKAIVSGEILNNYEDFRIKRSEDYLMIVSLSQAIKLSAVELIKTWAQTGKITDKELASLSMSRDELMLVTELELASGPIVNAIFNKIIYQQSMLGRRMPGKWGERIFNKDEVLGKLFLHTYQEKRAHRRKLKKKEGSRRKKGAKGEGDYATYKMRSRDFVYPEWLMAAKQFEEFIPIINSRLSAKDLEANWQGIGEYFKQLDVVMRSQTLDRKKIDEEYEKLYKIAREISPKVRFLVLPPTMEDSSLAVDGMFTMLWQSDKDRERSRKYAELTPIFQETIDRVEFLRPGLVSRLDLVATEGISGTLINVSGQTSESRLQGGRIWRRRAEIHDEVIDNKTENYRWPLLVAAGLVDREDLRLLGEIKEAVKWYMLAHEETHGVIPDYRRGAVEELKCDLFGLNRLIKHWGGIDNIPWRMKRALVLAVVSEDLFNLSSSSAEPGSLGSLYLVPSVLRMNKLIKSGFIEIRGSKIRLKAKAEAEILELLANKWGGQQIMEDMYLWARKNTAHPSDKRLLKEIARILKNNRELGALVQDELPRMVKAIGAII